MAACGEIFAGGAAAMQTDNSSSGGVVRSSGPTQVDRALLSISGLLKDDIGLAPDQIRDIVAQITKCAENINDTISRHVQEFLNKDIIPFKFPQRLKTETARIRELNLPELTAALTEQHVRELRNHFPKLRTIIIPESYPKLDREVCKLIDELWPPTERWPDGMFIGSVSVILQ